MTYQIYINKNQKGYHSFIYILKKKHSLLTIEISLFYNLKMQKGEAVPFILIDESVKDQDVDYTFRVHPKAHQIFTSDLVRNKKVAIAAVAGPQRTGKSFLSNRLLKRMTGFAIGPSTMPCTKGLWIWGEPIKVSQDTVLIIMDTEGLNSVQRDVNVDLKIFSLSILLSSVFIYNSIGHIDEKALENMSYVLRISENIKINSDTVESQTEMSKYFPYFYWVLRDFSLDLKGKSQNEYLEESLKPVSNDEKDPRNQIRGKIRKLFAHRRCDCFPRPVLEENRLAHIENLNYEQLRDNFKNKMKNFERTFYSSLPPKTINNKPITGSIYLNLVYEYVNAMNSGGIPKIMTSLESVISAEIRKVCDNYKSTYRQAMDDFTKADKMAMDQSDIQANHKKLVGMIESKLEQKFKIWGDVKMVQVARAKFMEELSNDLKARLKQNSKKAELQATRSLRLFQQIQLPELKNSDMITTTLVTEKQQEFGKKYAQYVEKNKGSTKYVIFTKKFPALIFGYFSNLVARIKGVYTEEMNQIKIQSKNSRAEVESLKRIVKEHEQLFLVKEKEIEGLVYERDQLKRELNKIEEMGRFEKQTEKMSKKQVKKQLEDLKRQLLQIEGENEDLINANNKLREEVQKLKTREPKVVVESVKKIEREDTSNLPNDLVYALMGLKAKLSSMNQFYEKKATDEGIDDYMTRQIEEIREDKYSQIEKIRDECRSKIEDSRKKTEKIKDNYEKQLEMINKHLDDIKNQNIELEKRISEGSGNDSKRWFVEEKKRFEESLRLKQNHLDSQKVLNEQKQHIILSLKEELQSMCEKYAESSIQKASLESFKGNFWYLLRQSLNFALSNKNNKLKHAMKTLENEEIEILRKTLAEVGKPL